MQCKPSALITSVSGCPPTLLSVAAIHFLHGCQVDPRRLSTQHPVALHSCVFRSINEQRSQKIILNFYNLNGAHPCDYTGKSARGWWKRKIQNYALCKPQPSQNLGNSLPFHCQWQRSKSTFRLIAIFKYSDTFKKSLLLFFHFEKVILWP